MSTYLGFEPTSSDEFYFISYNSEDSERVSQILLSLLEHDVPIWYDYGIEYGSLWESTIAERIDRAKAILLFVTKGIFGKGQKSYVKKEWEIAKIYEKPVFVIQLDRIQIKDIPYDLVSWWVEICEKQCISANDYRGKKLIKEILKALGLDEKKSGPEAYITYAGFSVNEANKIAQGLKKQGIETFVPQKDFRNPQSWSEIEEGMKQAKVVIVLVTAHALDSMNFFNDIALAAGKNKHIVTVLLEDCMRTLENRLENMRLPLLTEDPIDMSNGISREKIKELATAISGMLKK